MRKHPRSRFNAVLAEEIVALQGAAARPRESPRAYESSFEPFDRLRPGVPQRFAVELDPRVVGGVVHVRSKKAPGYRSLTMQPVGERYWAATLPGDAVDEAGMEYFVEGVLPRGPAVPIIGTSHAPREAEVEQRPLFGKKAGTLAQFSVQSELASFNAKRQNDYLFQTEGNFGWRIQDVGIRAIRTGFGVFRGKGDELAVLDAGGAGRDVGLTYGHIEGEFGITPIFGIVARPIIGLREGGISGGAQGYFRIGNDLKTNLMVGGEVLGSVGLRGVVQLDWRSFKRVPVLLRSEVTNQPAGLDGDVGVRAIAQGGYELVADLVVAARVSYQGRTINHAGPGAGLGVSYQW
jgi:hypothetical protein